MTCRMLITVEDFIADRECEPSQSCRFKLMKTFDFGFNLCVTFFKVIDPPVLLLLLAVVTTVCGVT